MRYSLSQPSRRMRSRHRDVGHQANLLASSNTALASDTVVVTATSERCGSPRFGIRLAVTVQHQRGPGQVWRVHSLWSVPKVPWRPNERVQWITRLIGPHAGVPRRIFEQTMYSRTSPMADVKPGHSPAGQPRVDRRANNWAPRQCDSGGANRRGRRSRATADRPGGSRASAIEMVFDADFPPGHSKG